MKTRITGIALAASATLLLGASAPARAGGKDRAARGRELVTLGGCNDCHTPLKMGQNGPEPDMARMLSGHPEHIAMPAAPALPPGPWAFVAAGTMTAWSGPWGVSYTANLTPDPETGLGRWTERDFIETMRTGRHMGRGRQILPPMPVQNLGQLPERDLKDIFAYLKSIPAVKNQVPQPVPPAVAAR
jgi:mono/diheme cytochrome c family protein